MVTAPTEQATTLLQRRDARYTELFNEKMAELMEQFSGVGVEYHLLLERVAKSHAALSCVDEGLDPGMSGLDYDRRSGELRKNITVILAATSKNKAEMVQQARQDGAALVLEVALRTLQPDAVRMLGEAVRRELAG